MTGHFTDAELREFARGSLDPDRLLRADDHLAVCDRCRRRAADLTGATAQVDAVLGRASTSLHPDDDRLQSFVEGTLGSEDAGEVRDHLSTCAVCAEQVRDLREWSAPPAPRTAWPRRWLAVAAAIVAVVLVPASLRQLRSRREVEPPSLAGLASLPPAVQQRVRDAVSTGAAREPAFMADLARGRETLMGANPTRPVGFEPLAPVATGTATDTPRFEWTPAAAADGYVVTVVDEASNVVARSRMVKTTNWTPVEPLARGRTYTWQVAMHRGTDTVATPSPPDAPARFHVIDAESSALLQRIQREHPRSHLLLGILDADAGLRGDAIRHLEQVRSDDRDADAARRLLEQLKRGDR